MKLISFFFMFVFLSLGGDPVADLSEEVVEAIKKGNAEKISVHFYDKVSIKIFDQEDIYSRAQAESVLKDFFTSHPVKSFTASHSSSQKSGNQFVVGALVTSTGTYRLSFLIKKYNDKFKIAQFRIENESE